MHMKRTAIAGICHIRGILTSSPSVRLFKTQRFLEKLHPVMYSFPKRIFINVPPNASVSLGKKAIVMTSGCCIFQQAGLVASLFYMAEPTGFPAETAKCYDFPGMTPPAPPAPPQCIPLVYEGITLDCEYFFIIRGRGCL